jgi:hypothetical protein
VGPGLHECPYDRTFKPAKHFDAFLEWAVKTGGCKQLTAWICAALNFPQYRSA